MSRFKESRGSLPPLSLALLVLCLEAPLTACDLTKVSAPDVIQPSSLNNPSGAVVRWAGAIGDFIVAYGNQSFYSGIIADEFSDRSGGSIPSDQRVVPANGTSPSGLTFPYDGLSQARTDALRAIETLELYNLTPTSRISEMFAYLGFAEVYFAEDMCSGVPLGVLVNDVPTAQSGSTREQLLNTAIAHFDSALAYAGGDVQFTQLASVGRARALLDSGALSAAAGATANVPASFAFLAQYDTLHQTNSLFANLVLSKIASVSDREGGNGLDFISANDPRLVTADLGPGSDGDEVFAPAALQSLSTPLAIATGIEAQLIRAESALPANGGAGTAWLDTLNALRTDGTYTVGAVGDTVYNQGEGGIPGLAPLGDPGSDSARASLVFRERAFWLFGTGHRQGDLRRLVRQYHRPIESVFPTGPYQNAGLSYGTDVTYVPFGEQYNPHYTGCIDRLP